MGRREEGGGTRDEGRGKREEGRGRREEGGGRREQGAGSREGGEVGGGRERRRGASERGEALRAVEINNSTTPQHHQYSTRVVYADDEDSNNCDVKKGCRLVTSSP